MTGSGTTAAVEVMPWPCRSPPARCRADGSTAPRRWLRSARRTRRFARRCTPPRPPRSGSRQARARACRYHRRLPVPHLADRGRVRRGEGGRIAHRAVLRAVQVLGPVQVRRGPGCAGDPAAGTSAAPARANAAIGSIARHRRPFCDIMGFSAVSHVRSCTPHVSLTRLGVRRFLGGINEGRLDGSQYRCARLLEPAAGRPSGRGRAHPGGSPALGRVFRRLIPGDADPHAWPTGVSFPIPLPSSRSDLQRGAVRAAE